ncbi:hypothetical protein AB833_16055 [Chromatiales bacterium (ex Bugula neritina AB1)]|nr:hypothetical protein AB833_16055 [Chromatiales bacterium (ex Bugula neritina AB1)]
MSWVILDILIPLFLVFGLGVWLGWMLWRWRRQKFTADDLETLQTSQTELESKVTQLESMNTSIIEERDKLAKTVSENAETIDSLRGRISELETAPAIGAEEILAALDAEEAEAGVDEEVVGDVSEPEQESESEAVVDAEEVENKVEAAEDASNVELANEATDAEKVESVDTALEPESVAAEATEAEELTEDKQGEPEAGISEVPEVTEERLIQSDAVETANNKDDSPEKNTEESNGEIAEKNVALDDLTESAETAQSVNTEEAVIEETITKDVIEQENDATDADVVQVQEHQNLTDVTNAIPPEESPAVEESGSEGALQADDTSEISVTADTVEHTEIPEPVKSEDEIEVEQIVELEADTPEVVEADELVEATLESPGEEDTAAVEVIDEAAEDQSETTELEENSEMVESVELADSQTGDSDIIEKAVTDVVSDESAEPVEKADEEGPVDETVEVAEVDLSLTEVEVAANSSVESDSSATDAEKVPEDIVEVDTDSTVLYASVESDNVNSLEGMGEDAIKDATRDATKDATSEIESSKASAIENTVSAVEIEASNDSSGSVEMESAQDPAQPANTDSDTGLLINSEAIDTDAAVAEDSSSDTASIEPAESNDQVEPLAARASVGQPASNDEGAVVSESDAAGNSTPTVAGYVPRSWQVPDTEPDKTQRDKLTEIKGVGPVLEKALHSTGIYYFRQVALLDEDGVVELQEQMPNFPGRIQRDDWVSQARQLHENKYGTAL